ncbi:MAG: sugar transporter, partial [Paracoccaceae bacterium]
SEEGGSASDLLGGLAQFTGGSASGDADILYEFIQSQGIVDAIDDRVDLVAHYAQHWPEDPAFALWPTASVEDLLWFWQRVIRISYDQSTGLIEVRALAFDPETAQTIAREIVRESQSMINELNATARDDLMRYAQADLDEAVARLKAAREALTRFRTRTQIVDPSADIQGRMGVLNNLQQQLAEALIDYDLLIETTSNLDDPRLAQARRKIDVIRERIARERENFASDEVMGADADYPTLMAEFESLTVDREFAEESYRSALAALDIARANASRQSRYLATYVPPTRPQTSEYPQRWVLTGLAALFLSMAWAITSLVYYSIRDRR